MVHGPEPGNRAGGTGTSMDVDDGGTLEQEYWADDLKETLREKSGTAGSCDDLAIALATFVCTHGLSVNTTSG